MNYIILIGIAVVGIMLGYWLARQTFLNKNLGGQANKTNKIVRKRKEEAKQNVMKMLETKDKITNNNVENLLGVSDATATNYLQELESEGKLKQEGKTGKGVVYIKTNA